MNKLSHFVYSRLPAGLFSSSQRKRTNTLQHFKFDHLKLLFSSIRGLYRNATGLSLKFQVAKLMIQVGGESNS